MRRVINQRCHPPSHEADHLHRERRGREDLDLRRDRIPPLPTWLPHPADEHRFRAFPRGLPRHETRHPHHGGGGELRRVGDRHNLRDAHPLVRHTAVHLRVHDLAGHGGDLVGGDGDTSGDGDDRGPVLREHAKQAGRLRRHRDGHRPHRGDAETPQLPRRVQLVHRQALRHAEKVHLRGEDDRWEGHGAAPPEQGRHEHHRVPQTDHAGGQGHPGEPGTDQRQTRAQPGEDGYKGDDARLHVPLSVQQERGVPGRQPPHPEGGRTGVPRREVRRTGAVHGHHPQLLRPDGDEDVLHDEHGAQGIGQTRPDGHHDLRKGGSDNALLQIQPDELLERRREQLPDDAHAVRLQCGRRGVPPRLFDDNGPRREPEMQHTPARHADTQRDNGGRFQGPETTYRIQEGS